MQTALAGHLREGLPERRAPLGVRVFRNLWFYPAEVGSMVGFAAIAAATPFMVEPSLGAVVPLTIEHRWLPWVSIGLAGATAFGQFLTIFLDWRRGRLWACRMGMVASAFLFVAFAPIKFYGAACLALCLATTNTLSTAQWSLRASEQGVLLRRGQSKPPAERGS